MRTWYEWEIYPEEVPVDDRYTHSGWVYERRMMNGQKTWKLVATQREPLDDYDKAFLRSSFGLSEEVEL